MDSLITLRRPIRNVKPARKSVKFGKSKKLQPPSLAKREKPTFEAIPESKASPVTEQVSFVSLYHDLCRARNEVDPASGFLSSRYTPAHARGSGDHSRVPFAHLVVEMDY